MGDSEKNTNTGSDELIDISDFDSEFEDDALTEVESEEETTPIRTRLKKKKSEKKVELHQIEPEGAGGGTFVATLRERFAAFFIDSLFLFYAYWVLAAIYCRFILGSFDATIPFSNWHGLILHGAFLLICFLYYFMLEGIFLTTIGKFVCWMSVRKKNFEAATLPGTFIRNLLRPIDYVLIFPVIFIMELTKYRQRIGDLIAKTTVVKKFGTIPGEYEIPREMIASGSGRTLAIFIDMFFFIAFISGYVLVWSPEYAFISGWLLLLTPLAMIFYFVFVEMLTETTPGKWIMGYIICHDNGRRLTISGSIVRTIWRLFDTNPIGLLCVYISTNRQRPGDTAAGTLVLKHKRTVKGAVSIVIASVLAILLIYTGLQNDTNILSPKFRFNFLPKLSFVDFSAFSFGRSSQDGDLEIKNFRFASGDPNYLRVPPTFQSGENLFLVFEIDGYAKRERKVWLQEDLLVKYPDGSTGLQQNNIVDYQEIVKGSGPIELTNNIELPVNANPGNYEINITIRDKYAGNEVGATQRFYIRRPLMLKEDMPAEEAPQE